MRSFKSRELAMAFDMKVSRWKRCARDFLPTDPFAGLQQGVSRTFELGEAFKVFLGAYCLRLRFTVPETKQILSDLEGWLKKKGVFFNGAVKEKADDLVLLYEIEIERQGQGGAEGFREYFIYNIKGLIHQDQGVEYKGLLVRQDLYTVAKLNLHGTKDKGQMTALYPGTKTLEITKVFQTFVKQLSRSLQKMGTGIAYDVMDFGILEIPKDRRPLKAFR